MIVFIAERDEWADEELIGIFTSKSQALTELWKEVRKKVQWDNREHEYYKPTDTVCAGYITTIELNVTNIEQEPCSDCYYYDVGKDCLFMPPWV